MPEQIHLEPSASGRFHLPLALGDFVVDALVDTGATCCHIRKGEAARLGLAPTQTEPRVSYIDYGHGAREAPVYRAVFQFITTDGARAGRLSVGLVEWNEPWSAPVILGCDFLRQLDFMALSRGVMTLSFFEDHTTHTAGRAGLEIP